ncbi:hypothetical protein BCR15_10350 [Tessaracoccus lapidicaptus]|uniref:Uncharacterized protein n=1 Tax=Tessaracoccus lapidicaptus TaxID=1427523 RepID=A0A1C0AGM0_9ACTN|nr:hypothetical protein [Tessaracoccus lapidicaptus]OCL30868.1 hypothetical protein BCR15_10350 [Tessaracoccus lapidicaptus]
MVAQLEPFPDPSERMLAAYVNLAYLARGGTDAEAIMANGEILPRPWDLTTIADPHLRSDTWQWLDAFVIWLNTQHAWYSADHTPPCWPEHPGLVRELSTLAALRYQAGEALSPIPLEEWHRYALPSYLDRTADERRACDEKHQPWPGRAAHTRHTSDDAAARRLRLFRDDVDPTPDAEQTVTLLAL